MDTKLEKAMHKNSGEYFSCVTEPVFSGSKIQDFVSGGDNDINPPASLFLLRIASIVTILHGGEMDFSISKIFIAVRQN